jgi:hypothetical protein
VHALLFSPSIRPNGHGSPSRFSLEIPTPAQVTTTFRPSTGPPGLSSSSVSPEPPSPPIGAASPCAAVCHSPPHASSRTELVPHLLHFPHQDNTVPSSRLPLLLFETTGIESPLPPATHLARSPPRLPDPIKGCHTPDHLHRAHPRSPLFTSSPRAFRR